MNEKKSISIEKLEYPDELEKLLNVPEIIDVLEKEFDLFLEKEKGEAETKENPELRLLRLIKLFIYKNRERVSNLTKGSSLQGFDCLTLAIITCLLANRKGYKLKIGRPDKILRYFHAVVIEGNGKMFQIAGRNVTYKNIKTLSAKEVSIRLKATKPLVNMANSIRGIKTYS